jgi:hypothetical protein
MTRRWLLVVVAAGAVLVATGGVVLVKGGLPWRQTGPCDIARSVVGGSVSSAAGGGIRVVEQGFTVSTRDGSASLGAVLANTGHQVAYRTRIVLRLLDARHRSVAGTSPIVQDIPIMLPGQRVGLGGTAPLAVDTTAASFQLELGTARWVPRDALGSDFSPVIATAPRTIRPDPTLPTTVDVHYTEVSTNCQPLIDGGAAVVYRDASGAIVGGDLGQPGGLTIFRDRRGVVVGGEQRLPSGDPCDPGTRDMWVIPLTPAPSRAAVSRTTVYPYCDVSPPGGGE